ncbi:excalibur calcium-binding domain-containing protein [Flavobacterium sp. W22_SRS_FK3]|uniref:excalibur calcium-binding domain-containing protein n=1 Tax=Flavobacterium sp. W22_SRS_FK3 TaxID=3240275 RepID=UPI003F909CBF
MGYRKGYCRKDGTYVQGHYANNRSKSFSTKNNNGCVILILVITTISSIISCSESSDSSDKTSNSNSNCPTKTCGDFTSQSQAQATFNRDRSCYKNLDADGDGIACESLK